MQENNENIEPNHSPELAELIRDNLNYQNQQNVKQTLFKQSLVKVSIDKDFSSLFQLPNQQLKSNKKEPKKTIEVCEELRTIFLWLEESSQFRGVAHLPFASIGKLLQILHQKVENRVIVVADYHSYWMEEMEEISRLSKLKWGFLNTNQRNEEKVKILQLYEMKKTKLFFVNPSLFKHEDYHEFQCDLLLFVDLHLYQKSIDFMEKIVEKCSPNRILGLYSTPLAETYPFQKYKMKHINQSEDGKKTYICLKTSAKEKLKTMLSYIEKNDVKRALVLVNNKHEAKQVTKMLKLKALTSFNLLETLTAQQIYSFSSCEVAKGSKLQAKVLDTIYKSQNYNITLSKYFDALRFGSYDCVIFYSFTDIPKFLQFSPDVSHRLMLLVDDDYHIVRNNITSQHLTMMNLMKIVMKIMEKPKKVESAVYKRYYSGYMEDNLLDCYSIEKEYAERDEEKVVKVNYFCKTYDINMRTLNRVLDNLEENSVTKNLCRVVYEVQIEEASLGLFRKKFPQILEIKRKVNILNYSTEAKKTTRTILEEFRQAGIEFKITEEVVQLKILKNYDDVDWEVLQETVNKHIWESVKDLDKSFIIYRDCAYGSIELTRREKYLQRKSGFLNFHKVPINPLSLNIFNSFHKSNLLTSEVQEWLKRSFDHFRDQHDLVMMLQGVENPKFFRYREEGIFGRYRRVRYEDLLRVVSRIKKNKKVKIDQ